MGHKAFRIMKPLQILIITFVFAIGLVAPAYADVTAADGTVYTEAQMDSLRLTPDFVTASVCIADPTHWLDDLLGTNGHAFIRLQCPTFDMDYCFSYESESVNNQFSRFLQGKLKMGMFRYTTNEYMEDYHRWNRRVREYTLNLPPEVETRLWEIMDNHVTNRLSLKLDLDKRGCANSLEYFVEKALGKTAIVYDEQADRRMTCIPVNLVNAWLHASVNGVPLLSYNKDLVEAEPATWWDTYIWPRH